MADVENLASPDSKFFFVLRFLMYPILGIALYPLFVMGLGGEHWLMRTVWVLFLGYCWFCAGSAFHETSHKNLFSRPQVNVWIGRLLGTLLGLPYTMYQESHRRHHAYLNSPDDPEMWPYCDPTCGLAFRRTFLIFDLLAAFATIPYIMGRIYFQKNSPLKKEAVRKTIRNEYLAIMLFWTILIVTLLMVARSYGYRIWDCDPVWLLPLAVSQSLSTIRKLVEHLGMKSSDPLLGTRTILPSQIVTRVLCFFNFEEAIHGIHHRAPKIKYWQLAHTARELQSQDTQSTVPIFGSFFSAFCNMLPHLWNPTTGTLNAKSRFETIESPVEVSWEFDAELESDASTETNTAVEIKSSCDG